MIREPLLKTISLFFIVVTSLISFLSNWQCHTEIKNLQFQNSGVQGLSELRGTIKSMYIWGKKKNE